MRSLWKTPISFGSGLIAILAIAVVTGTLRGWPSTFETEQAPNGRAKPPLMRLIVPAYFYPDGPTMKEWNRMIAVLDQAPITIIANPASGPGLQVDPNYLAIIRKAAENGAVVAGYVSTDHGKRTVDDVRVDVERWARFYPRVSAIFLDGQMAGPEGEETYRKIRMAIKEVMPNAEILTNPGVICDEMYLKTPIADVACMFEGPTGFDALVLPRWTDGYAPGRFAAMPYRIGSADMMRAYIKKAAKLRLGAMYVTDASGDNPWCRLPAYWEEEVRAVHRVNQRQAP